MPDTMKGQRFLVTGAASGLGHAVAKGLLAAGAEVVAVDRNPVQLAGADVLQADFSREEEARTLAKTLQGEVHGLLNIAGVPPGSDPALTLKVNVLAPRLLADEVARCQPGLRQVLSVASVGGREWRTSRALLDRLLALSSFDDASDFAALHGIGSDIAYRVSKEALIFWTREAVRRADPLRRRFNTVSPGPVETPLWQQAQSSAGNRGGAFLEKVPHVAETHQIAAAIVALCGPAFDWMTGADIPLDGGLAVHLDADQPVP